MTQDGISVPYNRDLEPLEKLLGGVRRPGDFFVRGSLEVPMPRIEVDGVGRLSFPVPEAQIHRLIEQATRAPYGRGEETVLDESVRKVWQVPASRVHIGGKTWERTFAQVLDAVVAGLGCGEVPVSAELYKLLVYDPGGHFKVHRDTEKAGGMFATLVVVLPSAHRGGELVIRHADRTVVVDARAEEPSELTFAAFYADCEHEVRPITEGHRVCLIYNLVQTARGRADRPLRAPLYASEIDTAARLLKDAFAASDAPAKLAWLLAHQYSPAALSFAGLKGEDAARVKVLCAAAAQAGCAVHLGIVHIEESGSAEPDYDAYAHRRSGWRRYDEDNEDADAASEAFEVIEVSDSSRHIDHWVNLQDEPVAYGRLPLDEGEVLPAGALDDEEPDAQRLMEATGNEGASFERSYHRAAVILWPRERFTGVLLEAGVGAALPYLSERIAAGDQGAAAIARDIIDAWEQRPTGWSYRSPDRERSRAEMLRLLVQLGDRALLTRFIGGVVTGEFDGSENEALTPALQLAGPETGGKLLTALARENFPVFHCACVDLLERVRRELGDPADSAWQAALREAAAVMVQAIPTIEPVADPFASPNWQRLEKAKPVDAGMVVGLLDTLHATGADTLRMDVATTVVAGVAVFDPGRVIVPALQLLQECEGTALGADAAVARLWVHAAEFLLARSEQPPSPPRDWRQVVTLSCQCEDCCGLQAFAGDPKAQVARFRVRKDRRQHLHHQIERHGLDMSHVTERRGSPQTLVCTKTRRTFERACIQHRTDCASMRALLDMVQPIPEERSTLAARLRAATARTAPG